MSRFVYRGDRTNEISFPLGGIGTGCVGLAGNGRLIDWEIYNRPNKSSLNGFSHFAVKAEAGGRVLDARALQGDLHPPYTGERGFGPSVLTHSKTLGSASTSVVLRLRGSAKVLERAASARLAVQHPPIGGGLRPRSCVKFSRFG